MSYKGVKDRGQSGIQVNRTRIAKQKLGDARVTDFDLDLGKMKWMVGGKGEREKGKAEV